MYGTFYQTISNYYHQKLSNCNWGVVFKRDALPCTDISKQNQNAVLLELGKTGIIYNRNFDHRLATKNFGFRLGAGSNLGSALIFTSFGGGAYHLSGRKTDFFEFGVDIQYLKVTEVCDDQRGFLSIFIHPDHPVTTVYPSLNLGYRR